MNSDRNSWSLLCGNTGRPKHIKLPAPQSFPLHWKHDEESPAPSFSQHPSKHLLLPGPKVQLSLPRKRTRDVYYGARKPTPFVAISSPCNLVLQLIRSCLEKQSKQYWMPVLNAEQKQLPTKDDCFFG
mmetsp:Transcript_41939/g.68023  ORF Transcript_41939/g.68023 Transcript_41939/m.68023 type:complete len:128 (-) Transcript_41939:242-625(-)